MAKEWHIDGVTALIVDGVRFTLQRFEYRSYTWTSTYAYDLWTRDADQSGGGFAIEAPLLFTDCKWMAYENMSTTPTQYAEATFYEDTFAHYGTAGMPTSPDAYTPPPYTITTLAPHSARVSRSLAFDPLGARGVTGDWDPYVPDVCLWINGVQQRICTPLGYADASGGYYTRGWTVRALGQNV